jgi:nicotinate phosphoribosyltransferase
MLESPSADDIASGGVTDHCCTLSLQVLRRLGIERRNVTLEAHVRKFPVGIERGIFFGLHDVMAILGKRPVRVWSLPQGSFFQAGDPVVVIEGPAEDLAIVRPALTGVLTFGSSIVSRANRFVAAAAGKPVLFFGLRKVHPAHVRQYLECAYVAGMEIDATPQSAAVLARFDLADCQEHFTNLVANDPADSWAAFLDLPRQDGPMFIVLDNDDDPVAEVRRAVEKFGPKLKGVLIDTDSSRRGNFAAILAEVSWRLRLMDRADLKLCVTGNVTPSLVQETAAMVASYGVGLSVLDAPLFDFSLQVVAVDGKPRSKIGVRPGKKDLFVCSTCGRSTAGLFGETLQCCGKPMRALMSKADPTAKVDLPAIRDEIRRLTA